jgi:DNA-binding transcriptional MerR regulator
MTKAILLSTREVAERKGLTTRQVQRLVKSGLITPETVGPRNTMFFKASAIRNMPTSLRKG